MGAVANIYKRTTVFASQATTIVVLGVNPVVRLYQLARDVLFFFLETTDPSKGKDVCLRRFLYFLILCLLCPTNLEMTPPSLRTKHLQGCLGFPQRDTTKRALNTWGNWRSADALMP